MALAILAAVVGLVVLVWAADKFVDGAAAAARHFGMPSLLVGIVIVGFGTSAPEMVVSALSAAQGASGLALGNAYGSNIANIGLILGVTALISPALGAGDGFGGLANLGWAHFARRRADDVGRVCGHDGLDDLAGHALQRSRSG